MYAKNDDKTGVREREAKKISSQSLREGPAGVFLFIYLLQTNK